MVMCAGSLASIFAGVVCTLHNAISCKKLMDFGATLHIAMADICKGSGEWLPAGELGQRHGCMGLNPSRVCTQRFAIWWPPLPGGLPVKPLGLEHITFYRKGNELLAVSN